MSGLFDELEKQARLLAPQEKASLARILIEELDPVADRDVEQLWIAESQRRYQAYLKGEMESLPVEWAKAKRCPPRRMPNNGINSDCQLRCALLAAGYAWC